MMAVDDREKEKWGRQPKPRERQALKISYGNFTKNNELTLSCFPWPWDDTETEHQTEMILVKPGPHQ